MLYKRIIGSSCSARRGNIFSILLICSNIINDHFLIVYFNFEHLSWGENKTPVLYVLDFLPQLSIGANSDCPKAVVVGSVVKVTSCPISIGERDRAAYIKNCSKLATQQNCSDDLVYHCVINGFRNETLEVCATKRLIDGDVYALIFILYSI